MPSMLGLPSLQMAPEAVTKLMQDSDSLCALLLDTGKTAFSQRHFMVAYHALSASMYCCLESRSLGGLEDVLGVAQGHVEELKQEFGNPVFPNEPAELSLYLSLVQVARTRLVLYRK